MPTNEPTKPVRVIRLNYLNKKAPDSPTISLIGGEKPEIRLAPNEKSFMSITPDGIAMSPGMGNSFTLQAMSGNMTYAGMLQDLPFPLALLPTTPATPFPKQYIKLPFLGLFPQILQGLALMSSFTGI
jgi:hypothetical protein